MAIIFQYKSICSICEKELYEKKESIAWKAFLDEKHKFWKYSDSAMHQSCFEKWEHKTEFIGLYKIQPLLDLDNPELKKEIEQKGKPLWIKDVEINRKGY